MEPTKDKSPAKDTGLAAVNEVSLADSALPSLRQDRARPKTFEQEWVAEKSKIAVLKAMLSTNDITELKQLVENGAPINWEYGGALQIAINYARPDLIRYLLDSGASTKEVYLGLWTKKVLLDTDCLGRLLNAGVNANWIDGQSPALERICHFAFCKDFKGRLSSEDRESVKKVIDMLVAAGARSSNLLKRAAHWYAVYRGRRGDLKRCDRCSWIVEYLMNKGLEVHCPFPSSFLVRVAERYEWAQPARNKHKPTTPGGLALNAVTRELYKVTTRGRDSLEKGREMLRSLTSEGKWKREYADQLLMHCVKKPNMGPVLDLLKHKKQDIGPEVLALAFCRACKNPGGYQNILEKFFALGVDVEAHNNYPLRVVPSLYAGFFKAKLLVERGAHIGEAELEQDLVSEAGPAPAYMFLLNETLNPDSELYFGKILPEELVNKSQMLKCRRSDLQQKPAFRFLSHCAGVAVLIGGSSTSSLLDDGRPKNIFKNFVARANNELKKKEIADVESRAAQVFRSCPGRINELSYAFVDAIVLPALVRSVGVDEFRLGAGEVSLEAAKVQIRQYRDFLVKETKSFFAENFSLQEFGKFLNRWEHVHTKHPRTNNYNSWWHPLIKETELAEGVTIHAISSFNELVKEGEQMGNCLKKGLGATNCLLGLEHILAIRMNGESVLTLTVKWKDNKGAYKDSGRSKWRVDYFEGRNYNKEPSSELTKYIDLFQSRLDSGEIATREAPFGQTTESEEALRKALCAPIERALGFDFKKQPTEALAFYEHTLSITADDWRGTERKIHLPIFTEEAIPEPFAELAKSLQKGHGFGWDLT